MRAARVVAATNSALIRPMASASTASGTCQSGANGTADGASAVQAPSSAPKGLPPPGGCVEALRPAWAS